MIFTVTKSPSELAALTNCVFVNPTDLNASVVKYLCIKEDYILSVKYVCRIINRFLEVMLECRRDSWAFPVRIGIG